MGRNIKDITFEEMFGDNPEKDVANPLYQQFANDAAKARAAERRSATNRWVQDQDNVELLLDFIASGGAVSTFCKSKGLNMTSVRQFLMDTSNGYLKRYEEAKAMRGYAIAEQAEDVVNQMQHGLIDPKTGKAVLDGKQWLARVYNPAQFSEKSQVDHNVQVSVQTEHMKAIRELSAERNAQWQRNLEEGREQGGQDFLPGNRFAHDS